MTIALAVSCAQAPPAGEPGTADVLDLAALYPLQAGHADEETEITAKVRLSLPKYRIRGACSIFRSPEGALQVDFIHSSIFGSYREDATIFVAGDTMMIRDNERDLLWGPQEALDLVSEHFEFAFGPEDVVVFLLLGAPREEDLEAASAKISGDEWSITGMWKGRPIEIEGVEGLGPVRFRICASGGTGCYEARYSYRSGGALAGYPDRIVCERIGGSERLSISVESVGAPAIKNMTDVEQGAAEGVSDR